MTVTAADEVTRCARGLVTFLESSGAEVPPDLFHADVLIDFTMPTWRLQARGIDGVVGLRQGGHPWPGRVPRSRLDRAEEGVVLEVEEAWGAGGDTWDWPGLMRAGGGDGASTEISL